MVLVVLEAFCCCPSGWIAGDTGSSVYQPEVPPVLGSFTDSSQAHHHWRQPSRKLGFQRTGKSFHLAVSTRKPLLSTSEPFKFSFYCTIPLADFGFPLPPFPDTPGSLENHKVPLTGIQLDAGFGHISPPHTPAGFHRHHADGGSSFLLRCKPFLCPAPKHSCAGVINHCSYKPWLMVSRVTPYLLSQSQWNWAAGHNPNAGNSLWIQIPPVTLLEQVAGDRPTSGAPTSGFRTAPWKLDLSELHSGLFVSTRSMPCRQNKPTGLLIRRLSTYFSLLPRYMPPLQAERRSRQ